MISSTDVAYLRLLEEVLTYGYEYQDKTRANIGMLQISNAQIKIPINGLFPIITTKKVSFDIVRHELIWMLSGSTNISYLQENNVRIWDLDANSDGTPENNQPGIEVGRVYGTQWRSWRSLNRDSNPIIKDQILDLVTELIRDPMSRRHIVTAWNPGELSQMALPPCHWSFEVLVKPQQGGYAFDLKWHQRSCDLFLGIPYDISLYGLLGYLIAKETGYTFDNLIGDLSNIHLYEPHIELAQELTRRRPVDCAPELVLYEEVSLFRENCASEIFLNHYHYKPRIKAKMYPKIK